jgi:group II intron reverse transcriptase/maturase
MKQTKLITNMDTKLKQISLRSKQESGYEINWLMQHVSVDNLSRCFKDLDGKKAIGVDKISKEEYGRDLDRNLENLVSRLKTMSYRPQAVRQVNIPKATGGTRPLGISTTEDKLVQSMFGKLLEAIYEPLFLNCSYGFRPDRNCHQAIKDMNSFMFGERNTIVVEIDFKNFFGSIKHEYLLGILGERIKDNKFLRYVSRMLKSGILDGNQVETNKVGTTQGSICSPILANIYGHYVLDLWFQDLKNRGYFKGKAEMYRYCDDAVFLFNNQEDVMKFKDALMARVTQWGLELHPEKSKILTMNKTACAQGVKQGTFSFLGFTFFLGKSKKGRIIPKIKTDAFKMRKKLKEIRLWLKFRRHKEDMKDLWKQLQIKMRGYQAYFKVSFNAENVGRFIGLAEKSFFYVMNRRSQKRSFSWEQFKKFKKVNLIPILPTKQLLFSRK